MLAICVHIAHRAVTISVAITVAGTLILRGEALGYIYTNVLVNNLLLVALQSPRCPYAHLPPINCFCLGLKRKVEWERRWETSYHVIVGDGSCHFI